MEGWKANEVLVNTYNGILFNLKVQRKANICYHKGRGPLRHYAKWNKAEKDKYCMISLISKIWKKKKTTTILVEKVFIVPLERVPEKPLLLLYWLRQNLWLCGSQQTGKFVKRWEHQTTLPASWEICM